MKTWLCALVPVALAFTLASAAQAGPPPFHAVRDFGAAGDGAALDTAAIQQAMDTCAAGGGGTVYFAPGAYRSGSLHLRSHVTLLLDNGATLLASEDDADFDPFEELGFEHDSDRETSFFHFSLLWGEDVEHVAILGQGTIDSNRQKREGPKTIGLKRCKEVTIRDVTIVNAGNYAISMLGTDGVLIDGVKIARTFCDGIDPDCCHNVRIANCDIESWDDAIVPKASFSLGYRRSTEYLTVTNCILRTACNAFKLGTESGGDFKHITVSNCVMATYESEFPNRTIAPPISGITLISADGSNIENVTIDNIAMDGVRYPIFLRLANRGRDLETPVPGTMKQVVISNITASGALIGAIAIGHPDRPIENVTLDHIKVTCQGGGDKEKAEMDMDMDIPAAMLEYPSANRFAGLRTYGVYARHVNGLRLEDCQLTLGEADTRHALIAHDVAELSIDAFRAPSVPDSAAQLSFDGVRGAVVRGCRPPDTLVWFLRASGESTGEIALLGNDFTQVKNTVLLEDGAPLDAVRMEGNLWATR